ncbi:MAG: 7-cyano-7-deazaguanine synthase [Gammaproteobacteria bacterium]|nr:7-cyano-7-deazaguanine synthase [Gammaproteobacteria bacterium]
MSNERVILCGGLSASSDARGIDTVPLSLWGKDSNVTLKVSDISQKMVANIAPALIDLLEIATYVYCADQATTRGGGSSREYGAKWRRQFRFHIPVREPDLWSSRPVRTALCDTLGFLSDDEYEFTFKKLAKPPPVDQYLDFGDEGATGFQAEEVVLFSGGLDSLGGAIQEAIADKRSVALVSHRSSPKIDNRQRALLEDLKRHSPPTQPFHVPVWINKEKALGREYTQRTRSFLYASLGAVVARIFGLWRVRFYENGVVSINLPISPQVVGGRATRTTHPQVLNGFSEIFTSVLQKRFEVENPFRWKTKAEVVKSIRDHGCGELIKHTVSCTHVWEMTTLKTHCGTCSQCIDRRFGTLSAGCADAEDPQEMYDVDLLRGERPPGDSRTMLESYVGMAKRVRGMTDTAFFTEFGEVHRVTRHIQGMSVHDAATQILALY